MTYKKIYMTFNIKRHIHARVIFRWFWGMLTRRDGGWRGISAAGRGYNEVLALEVRNVG